MNKTKRLRESIKEIIVSALEDYFIQASGSKVDYALIDSETGALSIAEHPSSQVILGRNTKKFKIENGKTYKLYSTGNRLIYGLYDNVVDGETPKSGMFVADSENASTIHTIKNTVNAAYLVVYYEQGTRIGIFDVYAGEALETDVFYSQAKNDHSKQYVIFSVEEVTRQDGRITCELEINCIDYGFDTELCENMADSITAALDHSVTIKEEIEFHVYANRRNNVTAPDEKIIRRRLTFDLYLYERN